MTPLFAPAKPTQRTPLVLGALGVTIVVGATMRLYGLSLQSLDCDELASWYCSQHNALHDVVYHDLFWNFYPPAFHLILHFVLRYLGDSENLIRLPSALAGILTIGAIFLAGARIFSEKEGLIAAAFTSFLLFPVYFSQEARPYSLLLLFTLLSVWFWTYLADGWWNAKRPAWWAFAGYLVAGTACCYLHYFGMLLIFFLGAVSIVISFLSLSSLAQSAAVHALLAAGFSPWLPVMLRQLRNEALGPKNDPLQKGIFGSFFDYVSSLLNFAQMGTTFAAVITVVALIFFGIVAVNGLWSIWTSVTREQRKARLARGFVFAVWLLGPFLFAYTKSATSASVFTSRNLIVSAPAVYLLVSRGLTLIPLRPRTLAAVATALCALACVRTVTSGYYAGPIKDQYRESVRYVVQHEREFPNALTVGYGYANFPYDYYFRRFGVLHGIEYRAGTGTDIAGMVDAITKSRARYVWYLCADPYPDNAFVDFMNNRFRILQQVHFLRVDVFLLEWKGGA